jgi:outer membrane lipoprotein-sorting protein
VTRWGTTAAESTIVRVEHKAPDRFRRTYLAPQAIYGEYVVSRGPRADKFEPKNARVIVTSNPALENTAALADNTTLVRKNYTPVLGSEETIADRKAATVALVNRFTGERVMRLWIDEETHIILAKETYHSDGSLESRVRFDQIRYRSDIPDSHFALDIPAGYHSVQGRTYGDPSGDAIGKAIAAAGFTPIGPKYLPDGFSIIGADTSNVKTIKSLHLLYSDGIRNLSLFENDRAAAADFGAVRPMSASFEGHTAQYVRQGPTTLLSWHERDLAFALVGDLDLKELIEIAKSVVP